MISFPPCKINLGLRILEKRSDGFHNIESAFLPVGWNDILEMVPATKNTEAAEIKITGIRLYGKENNLCLKAYHMLATDFQLPPVKMHLHKIIPVGAGLGGGSSDGVHTLLLLKNIFNLKISEDALLSYATRLGSDCPFFVQKKPMLATGKGEVLEPVKLKFKKVYCVIVKAKVHVSTAEAYSWIKPQKRNDSLKSLLLLPVSEWKNTIENDFEKVVFEKFPALKNIKNRLYKLGAEYASMSGSGSAMYGLFNEEKHLNTYFRSCTVWSGWIQV